MKKKVFRNKPDENKNGQYIFFNDLETEYSGSNSRPNYVNDKFSDKDLYTTIIGDQFNESIIQHKLQYPGFNFLRFDKLKVGNVGTGHRVHNAYFRAWIFDDYAYEEQRNFASSNPMNDSYDTVIGILNGGLKASKFYNYNHGTADARSWSPGTLIDNAELATDLSSDDPIETFNFAHSVEGFDVTKAFRKPWSGVNGTPDDYSPITIRPFKPFIGQRIYVAVWCHGDDKRQGIGKKYTDHRRARLHIWSINADELFDNQGNGKETSKAFTYSSATKLEGESGGGGLFNKSAPMFTADEIELTFNTNPSTAIQSFQDENLNAMTSSIQRGRFIEPNNYDSSFVFTQHPYSEIYNLNWAAYDTPTLTTMSMDFVPVPKVTLSNNERYSFQAYHTSSLDRQICSAPGQVNLDFQVSSYIQDDSFELNTTCQTIYIIIICI